MTELRELFWSYKDKRGRRVMAKEGRERKSISLTKLRRGQR